VDLTSGLLVGVVQRVQPLAIDRGGPGVAVEADLGDPLPGPAGGDRLTGGMARGVVVVAARRRALGVAARPGGHIHREHQRIDVWQAGNQHVAEPLGVDPPADQRGIAAAPAAPMGRPQAEMSNRGDRWGAQQRVAQLEQRIGAAGAAGVQLSPERAEPHQGGSWQGMAAQPDRTEHRQAS
jgi:hypothetical protein